MLPYDPKYDMPPRVDRFMTKHPGIAAIIIIVILFGAGALMEWL